MMESGRPAYVMLKIEEYRKLTGELPSLAKLLAGPEGVGEIDFEPLWLVSIINPIVK